MNTKKLYNVAFFFGAGVEGKGNFDIENGYEYLKKSLLASTINQEMLEDLKSFFGKRKFFENYSYSKDGIEPDRLLKIILIYKSINCIGFYDRHLTTLCSFLSQDNLNDIKDNIQEEITEQKNDDKYKKNKDSDVNTNISGEFKDIITGKKKYYSEIENPIFQDVFICGENDSICELNLNVGAGGLLDSYFHTIINPTKYGYKKFSRIFNYYWACYFTIVESILRYFKKNNIVNVDKYFKDEDKKLDYKAVLSNMQSFTKILYDSDLKIPISGTYYEYIKDAFKKYESKIECSGIITTNYYRFASQCNDNVIYLNGKLNLFEYPELLEVSNVAEEEIKTDYLFFPFIFGQSYLKPIIHKEQTEEFAKFKECLENTDILVVMGFNINEDDNHINSFLHEFVKNGKRLIIVDNCKKTNAHKKLKCDENKIEHCVVDYLSEKSEIIRKVFEKILNIAEPNAMEDVG